MEKVVSLVCSGPQHRAAEGAIDPLPLLRWLGSLAFVWCAAGCDSNPTPHPGQPDVYNDTHHVDPDRDPEGGGETTQPDPDSDPTTGFEDNHCDGYADVPHHDGLDGSEVTDTGPTDTSPDAGPNPCDPPDRGAETDSNFSHTPIPTGPQ